MVQKVSFRDFEGNWRLNREIEDKFWNKTGSLVGTAQFTPDNGDLIYEEAGELSFDGQPKLIATRRYRWQGDEEHIKILFEDGSAFHDFALTRKMPMAKHLCNDDFYHVTYGFADWPSWFSEWRVEGPKKNYRMVSRYTKI